MVRTGQDTFGRRAAAMVSTSKELQERPIVDDSRSVAAWEPAEKVYRAACLQLKVLPLVRLGAGVLIATVSADVFLARDRMLPANALFAASDIGN